MPRTPVGSVVLETIADGAIVIDAEGRVLQFNQACERIFGYSPEEVVGENVKMLMPSPYREEHDLYIANYLATGDAKVIGIGREVEGLRKDGAVFPMELSVGMVEDSGAEMFIGIVRDISERVESADRLRDSEALFRSMFEVAVDGIIVIDESGTIEQFNPACVQLFGFTPEEVIGQNVRMLMPEPFHREHDGYIRSYLESGVAKIIGKGREVRGQRKDGSTFPMDLSVGHSVADDEHRHFVGVIRDVSDRHSMEATLHEQAERLAQLLQRERMLSETQREFMSIATHEFRTPLAVIDASAQRMGSILVTSPVAEEASRRLESIRNNVRRITALIDSTLELSKAESEEFSLDLQEVDLLKLCHAVIGRQNNLVGANTVTLQTALEALVIKVDPQLIERVIENVVANGIKYSEAETPVTVNVIANDELATIHVRDHGVGISEDDQARVFERFYRVRSTSNLPGTGLGLYMCRKYMQMHGGDISVESQPGQGSVFTLILPRRSVV